MKLILKKMPRITGVSLFLITVFLVASGNGHIYAQKQSLDFVSDNAYAEIKQEKAIPYLFVFTLEVWIKPSDLSKRTPIFSNRINNEEGSFEIEVGPGNGGTGRISVTAGNTWIFDSENDVIKKDEWTHVAFVYTGNIAADLVMYINGKEITPRESAGYAIGTNSSPLRLGYTNGSTYKGLLDEVRLWGTERSQSDIQSTMYQTLTGDEDQLFGYWNFNGQYLSPFPDLSTYGNTGTITESGFERGTEFPNASVQGFAGIPFGDYSDVYGTYTLSDDIDLPGLTLSPEELSITFNGALNSFFIYGTLTFELEGETVTANLGSENNMGLIVVAGELQQININITENFTLKGLEIKTDGMGMEWTDTNGDDIYHIYGEADFDIDSESMGASFGSMSNPGIVIKDNKLETLDVSITSNLKLGNIELAAKSLELDYETSTDEIFVSGEAEFSEVFDVIIDFGSGKTKGLIIEIENSVPKFKIDSMVVEVDHLNLGTVDLKELKLVFDKNGITEADVQVIMGGSDEIGGTIKLDKDTGKLTSIDVYYLAVQLEDAIELFEGVQLAYVDGKLTNLENPSDLKVEAIVQVFAGGGMTFDGYSVALIEAGADLTVDKTGFDLKEEINFGTYRLTDTSWTTLLGHLEAHFKVDFPTQTVSASFYNDLPGSEPFIEIIESFSLSPTNLSMWIEVRFFVPDNIPVIGGDNLASVDGVFHYWYNNPSSGYMAAWGDIGFWKLKHTTGGQINFHDKSIDIIGSGAVANIKKYNPRAKLAANQAQGYTNSIHNFEVSGPNPPNFIMIDARWHQEIDTVLVTAMGPEGFYETNRLTILKRNNDGTMPDFGHEENMDVVVNDTSAYFMISTPAMDNEKEGIRPSMVNGRYNVVLSYPGTVPDSSTVKTYQYWQKPTVEMGVTENEQNNYDIDISYWSAMPDSVGLMVFVSDSASTSDGKLIANLFPGDLEAGNFGSYSMEYSPDFIPLNDSLYFYVVLNDGVNVPLKSSITDPHHHAHDINGSIIFPSGSDSLSSGLRVFLDEDEDGSWDTESTGGRESFAISHPDGAFDLLNVEKGTYNLSVVLPKGYRIKGTEDRYGSVEITFNGSPITANLEIETYTEN